MREQILESILKIKDKKTNKEINIISRELKFEVSKYSSKKEPIWHLFLNNEKIKKSCNYLFYYQCYNCNLENCVGATQILRKIRQNKSQCFQCNNINLNINNYDRSIKHRPEKIKINLIEQYENSKKEFLNYPDIYQHTYFLSHLSETEFNRIKKNIISLENGKYNNLNNFEFWSIFKTNNQMKFTYVLYDTINDCIIKANQPIMKCDNCNQEWRTKSLERFKNSYKILCKTCLCCNKIFKIRPIKNINNEIITYQSKLEHKFLNWCSNNNILVKNGPNIDYIYNKKNHKYKVDFMIGDMLIEIKDNHIWHKEQVKNGIWDLKEKASLEFIKKNNLNKFLLITPQNWNEKINEIKK
jgi:hypothetical protein